MNLIYLKIGMNIHLRRDHTMFCSFNVSRTAGESCPETKTPAPDLDEAYCSDIHAKHTLFCGTQVLQTRYYGQDKVLAVVIRTGFTTAKGELVRSILYPKPIGFKFYMDSIRFVLLLLAVAVAGISYCVYVYVTKGATLVEIVIRACDMLTIVVPPAMPWAMTVGCVYSQARLRKAGIFCISPPRINVSGKLKLMCFDKVNRVSLTNHSQCSSYRLKRTASVGLNTRRVERAEKSECLISFT